MFKSLLRTVSSTIRSQGSFGARVTRRCKAQRSLQFDELEPRLLMTARVWDAGGGADHNWTNRFNWQGNVAPVAGDDLVFPANVSNTATHNDFPGNAAGTFHSLSFAGGGYDITGNPVRITFGMVASTAPGSIHNINTGVQFISTGIQSVDSQDHNINVGDQVTLILNNAVSGSVPLKKQGTGRLLLAGNNTFSSSLGVQAGVVQLAHANALGTAAGHTIVSPGAAIELEEYIATGEEFPRTLNIAEPLTLQGTGIGNTGALRNVSGSNRWTGSVRLGIGPDHAIGVDAAGGEFTPDDLTISGVMSNFDPLGSSGFRKRGTGRLILSGTNSYTGTTLIEEGVIHMKNSAALGSPIGLTSVSTGAGLELSDVDLGGGEVSSLFINEPLQLSGNGFDNNGALRNLDGNNTWQGNISLTDTSRVGVDLAGDVLFLNALISGTGKGLTKAGAGELLLAQNNTYSGTTTVLSGILTVNGSQRFSPITVTSGVLQGIGTTGAVTVQSQGAISPGGNTIGTLTVLGDLSTGGGQIRITANANSNDRIIVTGRVNLGSSPFIVSGTTASTRLDIIQNDLTDAVAGTTNGNQITSINGQVFLIRYTGGTGNDVQLTRQNVTPMFTNRLVTPEINEGDSVIVSGTIVEPDPRDAFFMNIDWGDGQTTHRRFAPGTPRDINLAHKYTEDGEYAIRLHWTDESRQGNSATLQTVVHNVPPTVNAGDAETVRLNSVFRRRVRFADPGLDSFVATVDYGDGTAPETLLLGQSNTFPLRHRFTRRGTFRVSIQVTDNNGGIGSDGFIVIVA